MYKQLKKVASIINKALLGLLQKLPGGSVVKMMRRGVDSLMTLCKDKVNDVVQNKYVKGVVDTLKELKTTLNNTRESILIKNHGRLVWCYNSMVLFALRKEIEIYEKKDKDGNDIQEYVQKRNQLKLKLVEEFSKKFMNLSQVMTQDAINKATFDDIATAYEGANNNALAFFLQIKSVDDLKKKQARARQLMNAMGDGKGGAPKSRESDGSSSDED